MEKIGTIMRIRRYPVKSMMGEELEEAFVNLNGLAGDRVYALIDETNTNTGFPWMTARQKHGMILYKTTYKENKSGRDDVKVTTPEGKTYDINDPEFLKGMIGFAGRPLRLKYSKKGTFDSRPISLFGLETISQMGKEVGFSLDPVRFRANFYIDFDDKTPFFENSLVEKEIQIGDSLRLKIAKKIKRCVITTLDTGTAESKIEVLENIGKKHESCAGIYGEILKEGNVKKGDGVFLC